MSRFERIPDHFWNAVRQEMEINGLDDVDIRIEMWKDECAETNNIIRGTTAQIKRDALEQVLKEVDEKSKSSQ